MNKWGVKKRACHQPILVKANEYTRVMMMNTSRTFLINRLTFLFNKCVLLLANFVFLIRRVLRNDNIFCDTVTVTKAHFYCHALKQCLSWQGNLLVL